MWLRGGAAAAPTRPDTVRHVDRAHGAARVVRVDRQPRDRRRGSHNRLLEVGDDHEKSMVFVAGDKEIKYVMAATADMLEAREKGSSKNVVFRKLISTLTMRERKAVLSDPVPEGSRLVIVSTPIGMSGIKFEGCTLVVAVCCCTHDRAT